MRSAEAGTRPLDPYVPRVALGWEPDEMVRRVNASIVFVDVSGFTALSERLAARGRIGAEELTDAIGSSFAQLLAVAYAEGGSLLKFGGDALLLYFDGHEHEARACHAALRMRSRLKTAGRLVTSVGTVRLRMSVGIASGPVHLFRVGRSHHELIITGPVASDTVAMESTAEAGEILVSPATARAIGSAWLADAKGPGFLLRDRRVLAIEESFPEREPASREDVEAAVPAALREHLVAGGGDSEHRHVAIAFIHFDGTDALIVEQGEVAAARALDALVTDVQSAADRHGVTFLATDIDRDGGKIIVVAGVPRTLGDDEGRLLRAMREVADTEREISVRIGINSGHVFAGEVGTHFRRAYTVMGDAVNLAARVMAAAEPGAVLVTEPVLSRSRTAFATRALPPMRVKGKSEPVQAFALGAALGAQETREASALPLIGREAELKELTAAFDRAVSGEGCVVELTGPVGIGKSRLLEELATHAPDVDPLTVACEQYESAAPYAAARSLLRKVLGTNGVTREELEEAVLARAAFAMEWLPLLGDIFGVAVPETEATSMLEPRFRRQRASFVVGDILRAVFEGPHVLAFEDVHWMDDASAELLGYLCVVAAESPWLLVVTRRDEPSGFRAPDPATRLKLRSLDCDSARALVDEAAADMPLAPHEAAAIVDRAGGNPLFLEELVRVRGRSGDDELPESLEAVVAIDVDRLAPGDRRLLRYAAVLGMHVDVGVLSSLVGETLDAGELASRLGGFVVVERDGRARFRHRMLRDVAYDALPFHIRRDLHGRAGDAIEGALGSSARTAATMLSLHFEQARRYDKCWEYAVVAGAGAEAAFANVEAVELYGRALSAARRASAATPDRVAETWERLGHTAMLAGLYDRSAAAFREARKLLRDDAVAYARVCYRQARLASAMGETESTLRWVRSALERIRDGSSEEAAVGRADLRLLQAWTYQQRGRPGLARRVCEAVIEEAKARGDRRSLADAYMLLDRSFIDLGRPELATNAEAALALWEELGALGQQAILLNNLGGYAYYQGRWDEAIERYERARTAFERSGNVVEAGLANTNIAEIAIYRGDLDTADELIAEAVRLWRSLRFDFGVVIATRYRGRLELRRGRCERARALFEEARSAFSAYGMHPQAIECDAWIAESYVREGAAPDAIALVDEIWSRPHQAGIAASKPMLHRVGSYAMLAVGDVTGAHREAVASLEAARARGDLHEVALSIEALGAAEVARGAVVDPALTEERSEILERLKIVAPAPPPVVGGGAGGRVTA